MATLSYNLKKYLKFVSKKVASKAIAMQKEANSIFYTCFPFFGSFPGFLSLYFWRTKIINKKPTIPQKGWFEIKFQEIAKFLFEKLGLCNTYACQRQCIVCNQLVLYSFYNSHSQMKQIYILCFAIFKMITQLTVSQISSYIQQQYPNKYIDKYNFAFF